MLIYVVVLLSILASLT
ncbi:hypothetical protein [Vibrio aestuarianus]